jgi:hypothetical protein
VVRPNVKDDVCIGTPSPPSIPRSLTGVIGQENTEGEISPIANLQRWQCHAEFIPHHLCVHAKIGILAYTRVLNLITRTYCCASGCI